MLKIDLSYILELKIKIKKNENPEKISQRLRVRLERLNKSQPWTGNESQTTYIKSVID